jgi:uncharacterized protein (DUF697 family)
MTEHADAPDVSGSGRTDAATRAGAWKIVRRYVAISAGAGLITVPFVDVTALAGVHIALLKAITEYYGDRFSDAAANNIVLAIGTSLIPGSLGSIAGRRILKAMPFISPVAGLAGMAACSAAVSYGLGAIFIRHFEAGGTLATFDVEHLHHAFSRS